jgi:hypothetical protein
MCYAFNTNVCINKQKEIAATDVYVSGAMLQHVGKMDELLYWQLFFLSSII